MKMNKKGFTLIELLTVIAILGILVLLAAPKFLGYTEKANIAKIQTGIKAVETAVDLKSMENPDFTKDWVVLTPDQLQKINDSGKLIDREGFIKENLENGKNVPLEELDNIKWNSGGEFIVNPEDDSVYYYNKDINVSKKPDGSAIIPGDNSGSDGDKETDNNETTPPVEEPKEPEITYPIVLENGDLQYEDGKIMTPDGAERQPDGSAIYPNGNIKDKDGNLFVMRPDGILVHPDGSVTLRDGTIVPVATDADFVWQNDSGSSAYTMPGKSKGFYKYIGTKDEIVIPSYIEGNKLTNLSYMFFNNSSLKKIISFNENITSLDSTFYGFRGTSLDLSSFETKYVTSMKDTFGFFSGSSLSLENWNTSEATDMSGMFLGSKVTVLDLSSFDTSNVENMSSMFASTRATSLNLSNFNTSKVTTMYSMFDSSSATSMSLSNFDTSKVTTMELMFNNSKATSLDLSSFTVNSSTVVNDMFKFARVKTGYAKASALPKLTSSVTGVGSNVFTIK